MFLMFFYFLNVFKKFFCYVLYLLELVLVA